MAPMRMRQSLAELEEAFVEEIEEDLERDERIRREAIQRTRRRHATDAGTLSRRPAQVLASSPVELDLLHERPFQLGNALPHPHRPRNTLPPAWVT